MERIASAAGELSYLDGGCDGLRTEAVSDSFLGEIHLRIVFGLDGFDCSSSCSLYPSIDSNNTDPGVPTGIFFDTEDKDLFSV